MAYLDNSGLSYFWSKIKALFGKLKITIGGPNSVGTAKAGTAKTAVSTYTPSGDIQTNAESVFVAENCSLDWSYSASNRTLYLIGINVIEKELSIPTKSTFYGNGVTFNIEQEN